MAGISTTVSTGPFIGNGVTTVFPFDFTALSPAEVAVQVNGVVVGGYSVTISASGTGSVAFATPPTPGASVLLLSVPDFARTSEFENEGAYKLSTVNAINRRASVLANWLRAKLLDGGALAVRIAPFLPALLPPALRGDPGPSNNTRASLAALQAAAPSDLSSIYDSSLWTLTAGNYSGVPRGDVVVAANGVSLTEKAWLRHDPFGGHLRDFGLRNEAVNNNAAFDRAFQFGSLSKPFPDPNGAYYGIGGFRFGKGAFAFTPITFGQYNNIGMNFVGDGQFSTSLQFDTLSGRALSLQLYGAVNLEGFTLFNKKYAAPNNTSVAINLDPTGNDGAYYSGGGGGVSIRRVDCSGFATFIRNFGAKYQGNDTGDGDKTLVEVCNHYGATCYDQTRNKQAYGWTFLNCVGASGTTTFRMGGSGETLITNYVGNVGESYIELPEGSGQPGGNTYGNYPVNRITVQATKLEYHGTGAQMLVDARSSKLAPEAGGSNVDLIFDGLSYASGGAWPNPAAHTVMQVGDATGGSSGVRFNFRGGWLAGRIKLGSSSYNAVGTRCSFVGMIVAPDPDTVELIGPAGTSHQLIEWRGNDNVPVDRYRGGEGAIASIDARKAFLWGHQGPRLINSGTVSADYGTGFGAQFPIRMAAKLSVSGMGVYVDKNTTGTTLIEWFATGGGDANGVWVDNANGNKLLGSLTIPAEAPAGKFYSVADLTMPNWQFLADGNIYVRITKPAVGQETFGRLVVFYFPYAGS